MGEVFGKVIRILSSTLFAAALLLLATSPSLSAEPSGNPKSILLLYSYGQGSKGVRLFDEGMLDTLFARGVNLNNLYFEYLDLERYKNDGDYLSHLTAELEHKYPPGKIDLIMTGQQPALRYLLERGKNVAPGAHVITFQAPPPTEAEAGNRSFHCILAKFDVEGTVRSALELFPATKKFLVVVGSSDADLAFAKAMEKTVAPFADKTAFEYTTGRTLDEVLAAVSGVPKSTLVLFTQFNKDSAGRVTVAYEVEGVVVKAANAPVFGLYDFNLRNGGVGGSVVSVRGLGVQMAELMLDVLSGIRSSDAKITRVGSETVRMFDWDQLKRWGAHPERLGPSAVFVNRTPGLWESYRWPILAAGALVALETALIAALLILQRRRRATERKLRLEQEKFSHSFRRAPLLMSLNDLETGRFIEVNDRFCEVTGFSREEVIGRSSIELGLLDRETRRNMAEQIRLFGRVDELALEMCAKDGRKVHILYSAEAIRLEGEELFVTIAQDVTEKRAAEEKARELSERLAQSQKMEAIGTLAGGIAHDFNNILGAILGYTELTLSSLPPESEERENLREVLVAGQRARDLVRQILAFSRKTERTLQPVDPARIVGEALKLLTNVIPRTISIEPAIDKKAGHVLADPSELHQVAMNLATNAYQAMSGLSSGVLRVGLRRVEAGSEVLPPGLEPGAYVLLEVGDTGPGMSEEVLSRIFEPYFTTKQVGGGTGLGLATVHGIVAALGGSVTVRSVPGKGTTFSVYLPVHEEAGEEEPERSPALPKATSGRLVLFVDDEPGLAQLGRKLLESVGYRVSSTTDPGDALRLFSVDPGEFDVLVTDMTMPGLNGAELIRRARLLRPDLPCVLCTGYSDLIDEQSAKALGIGVFVNKPFNRETLARAVAQAFEAGERSGEAT